MRFHMRAARGGARKARITVVSGGVVPMFSCLSSLRIEPRRGEMVVFWGQLVRVVATDDPRSAPKGRPEPRPCSSAVLLLRTQHSCPIRPYLFTSGIKGSYSNRQLRRVRCNDAKVAVVIPCSVNGFFFLRDANVGAERGGLGPPSARHLYRRWLSTSLPITPAVRSQSAGGAYPTCVRPGGVHKASAR
ncbi:hypothetical protein EDB85DRAFT_936571 [Lactarius pseudohatsudake]|nr:hypothetical protein EDB85DRAFT_936571 [Lactarius pseudohatsudake]